jgi:hypothetical protein
MKSKYELSLHTKLPYTRQVQSLQLGVGRGVTFLDTREKPLIFYSIVDATRALHVGRGVIDGLIRKKSKKSKGVYQDKTVYFTASYIT